MLPSHQSARPPDIPERPSPEDATPKPLNLEINRTDETTTAKSHTRLVAGVAKGFYQVRNLLSTTNLLPVLG